MQTQVNDRRPVTSSPSSGAPAPGGQACCVCNEPLQDHVTTLQACSHKGCTSCLKQLCSSAVAPGARLPVACPLCGVLIIMDDLKGIADSGVFAAMSAQAYQRYMASNRQTLFQCRAVGCKQAGCRASVSDRMDWRCDGCLAHYCLICQDRLGEAVPCHKGEMTCSECQANHNASVLQ